MLGQRRDSPCTASRKPADRRKAWKETRTRGVPAAATSEVPNSGGRIRSCRPSSDSRRSTAAQRCTQHSVEHRHRSGGRLNSPCRRATLQTLMLVSCRVASCSTVVDALCRFEHQKMAIRACLPVRAGDELQRRNSGARGGSSCGRAATRGRAAQRRTQRQPQYSPC